MKRGVGLLLVAASALASTCLNATPAHAAGDPCSAAARYSAWNSRAFDYGFSHPYFRQTRSQRAYYNKLLDKRDAWKQVVIRELRLNGTTESLRMARDFDLATSSPDELTAAENSQAMSAVGRSNSDFTRLCGFSLSP